MCKHGITTIKPEHQTTGNMHVIWSGESSFMMFPTSGGVYVRRTPRKPTIRNAWVQQWNTRVVLWWFGQQHHGIVLFTLLPFMAELLQGSTWTGWVIRCVQ
jgi:hypothetical protein